MGRDETVVDLAKWASSHAGLDLDISSISPLMRDNDGMEVTDSADVFTVKSRARRADCIILVSNAEYPVAVADAVGRAQNVADSLPQALRENILLPLCADSFENRSFAIYPKLVPFSKNKFVCKFQKLTFEREVYEWLSNVAKTTKAPIQDTVLLESRFVAPLKYVANESRLSEGLRADADQALELLDQGEFAPVCIAEHGDFWLGNILLEGHWPLLKRSRHFAVIDWGAANVCGYPFVDLLRFYESTSNDMEKINRYTARYCEISKIPVSDMVHYTLAAIGWLGLHRNQFPMERYIALSEGMAAISTRVREYCQAQHIIS